MPLLPFLKNKQREAGVIIQKDRAPDAPDSSSEEPSAIHAAAEDIIRAISDKDAAHLALALQAAYDICSSNPTEGDSLEDEI